MKILYINTFYSPHNAGGAENSLRVLVEAMHEKGHEVVVLATSDKKGFHRETVNGIKVYRGGIKNIYWHYGGKEYSKSKKLLWHIKDMYNTGMKTYVREVIALEKPDIVSCHNITGWSISIWSEIKKAEIPIVQVLHDFYFLCTKSTLFKDGKQCIKRCVECKLMRIFHAKRSKNIDAVVGVCQDVVNRITDAGYFTNSLKTAIHNVRVIPDTGKKHQYNEVSGPVFGFIGSLAPSKGILWLIEQFQKVPSKDIALKIAGKGDNNYENILKNTSKNDPRISFLGYTKSEDFYSMIDVLIIPSIWYEPLASVAIEACAHHIPVITSAVGGLREIITDRHNGLYCDISIPDSLSDAMRKIINDKNLLYELQKNARESVRLFLDIDRLTSEYEDVYKRVIARKML